MKYYEFKRNCDNRWAGLSPKIEKYGKKMPETWRNYSLELLFTLARNRLEETHETYKSIGAIDIDNLMDAMNFCDFLLCKTTPTKHDTKSQAKKKSR